MTGASVPQADPFAAYLAQKRDIDAAVARVLQSGVYILGPEVEAFEAEFAAWLGVRFAVGTASGTDALALGLRVLGIGPGDMVATVSHTATATVAAIELAGASPVLVDVEQGGFNMDPAALERLLADPSAPVRAVIPVHLYGRPARMAQITEIARRHGLAVLEDAAQAHGAAVDGRKAGSFGQLGAFSFYPTKNLGALGDAGALVGDDPGLESSARRLRQYGWERRFVAEAPGMNSRLGALQAAVLRVKLPKLDEANARRRAIAAAYTVGLQGCDLILPEEGPGETAVWHQYVVRTPDRERIIGELAARGVGTGVHYRVPVHLQPAYAGRVAIGAAGLAVTERLAGEILSLPIFPEMSDRAVQTVIAAVRAVCGG